MGSRSDYITLLVSLPAMPRHFEETPRDPIHLPRLKDRLKMLSEEDRAVAEQLLDFLGVGKKPRHETDEEAKEAYEKMLAAAGSPVLAEMVTFIMDMRMLMTAVRRRQANLPPPPVTAGQWGRHIVTFWNRADFNLGTRYPWLKEIRSLYEQRKVLEVERLFTDILWQHLERISRLHFFTFEAVCCYLVRWSVLHDWVSHDLDRGREHLDRLVKEAIGDHAGLFE